MSVVSESVTRSPIELFWTAKKIKHNHNHNFHIRMYLCRIYLSIIESIETTHFLVLSMTRLGELYRLVSFAVSYDASIKIDL